MAQYQLQIRPFDIPVSVTIEMPIGLKQAGPVALPTIPITDLPRETLLDLCNEFTSRVMSVHANAMKTQIRGADLQGDEYIRR